ncbi:MAG: hypothetical protein KAU94_00625 [Verrucomicrobia bacterium]|nr:hypothetical protein [Verrucomicrobiota bacterium]
MKLSTLIALYLLVIINLIGIGWIINDIGKVWNPPEHKEDISILDSQISTWNDDTHLILKVRNNASVKIRSLVIGVYIYDSSNTLVSIVEDYVFSTLEPEEERFVSAQISFSEINLETYRIEPFIGGAHTYYND